MPQIKPALFLACALAACAQGAHGDDDPWAQAYDAATQTRYLPLELIIGAPWDGKREIRLPQGRFSEGVARDPSTWVGPSEWTHPQTGERLFVYDRSRRRVAQKFAVRADGSAIGRVADDRFGIESCTDEAKYPLGEWRQSEVRHFESRCWYRTAGGLVVREMEQTISIEEIDFAYGGAAHSLRLRWTLRQKGEARDIDDRVYVVSPGRGIVSVR